MAPTASPKSVLERLQVKPGRRLAAVNVPAEVRPLLEPLPEGATASSRVSANSDVAIVFVRDRADLEQRAPKVVSALGQRAILWVAYPKQTGALRTDINRDSLYPYIVELGWTPNQQISIDDTWSALRFKPQAQTHAPSGT